MSAVASVSSSKTLVVADDTLELLFNENDGILTAEAGLEANQAQLLPQPEPAAELDAIISSILTDHQQQPDLDLEDFLNANSPGDDVMSAFLRSPPGNDGGTDADSFLGSPPLLPASGRLIADPSLVSRDHSYSALRESTVASSDEQSPLQRSVISDSSPSPPADIPLFIGEDVGEQRAAPGPMRHGRRSRNSTGSGCSLPYTVHDLDLGPGSPVGSAYEEDCSRSFGHAQNRRSLAANGDDYALGSPGELLVLTDEERLLLAREGVDLPDHLPLTREEERALRTVRRKIRNKISAKNSRLKKQEYVTGLEQRVKLCSRENRSLRGSVDSLRSQNRQLLVELRRLRDWVSHRLPGAQIPFGEGASPSKVAFYAVLLSFALVLTPMLSPFWNGNDPERVGAAKSDPMVLPGRTRTLLEKDVAVQVGDPYHITVRPLGPPWQVPPKSQAVPLTVPRSDPPPSRDPNASAQEVPAAAEPETPEEVTPGEEEAPEVEPRNREL